jgi:hypothetical protein
MTNVSLLSACRHSFPRAAEALAEAQAEALQLFQEEVIYVGILLLILLQQAKSTVIS